MSPGSHLVGFNLSHLFGGESTQTKRLGKGKPNSLLTFQRENFWREERIREKRRNPREFFLRWLVTS